MPSPRDDDTREVWVGRAPAQRPGDTAEFPAVPAQPTVVYLEAPRSRRWTVVVGLMLICFAAGATVALLSVPGLRSAVGLGPGSAPDPSVTQPPQTPTTPPPPPPPGLGDPVRDTAVEFTVTSVECGHPTIGEGIFTQRAAGQFCLVGLVMRNVGGALAIVSDNDQWAITADGVRHRADHDATVRANGSLFTSFVPVVPGDSVIGTVVFDIPADSALATVELHDNESSVGAVITA
jgi:hypothetical protein